MSSPIRKIATSTLWQLGSQITMAALSVLNVKFIAIALQLDLVGYYNSAFGYLQIFGIIADFGLYAVSVREMSRAEKKDEVLSALMIIRVFILCLSLGSAIIIAWLIPAWRGTALPISITIAAFLPFFTLIAGTLRSVFQIHYHLGYIFVAEVTQRILTTILLGFLVYFGIRGSSSVQLLLFCLLTGGIGAYILLLLSYAFARRFTLVPWIWNWQVTKRLLKLALPFGLSYLLISVCRQFDTTFIALLRSDFETQNAYYGTVLRMADMGFLIPTFLLNSILPIVSEREEKGQDASIILGKTFLTLLVLGVIAALFSFFLPRPLIALLTTERYLSTATHAGSDTALSLIAIPMLLNGMILFGFYVFLIRGAWKRLAGTLAIGAAVSVTLNFILIPKQGFVGAAYTAIVVNILLTTLLLPQALSVIKIRFPRFAVIRIAIFSLLLAGTLWLLQPLLINDIRTFLALGAMTAVLGVLLWISGILKLLGSKAPMTHQHLTEVPLSEP
ncbi:MAG: oligosaccharide flippase family protein [Candidatus Peregrinibacteria bacterium]